MVVRRACVVVIVCIIQLRVHREVVFREAANWRQPACRLYLTDGGGANSGANREAVATIAQNSAANRDSGRDRDQRDAGPVSIDCLRYIFIISICKVRALPSTQMRRTGLQNSGGIDSAHCGIGPCSRPALHAWIEV